MCPVLEPNTNAFFAFTSIALTLVPLGTANPTWGDIFECCFKAQSSKLERLFSLKRSAPTALSVQRCESTILELDEQKNEWPFVEKNCTYIEE